MYYVCVYVYVSQWLKDYFISNVSYFSSCCTLGTLRSRSAKLFQSTSARQSSRRYAMKLFVPFKFLLSEVLLLLSELNTLNSQYWTERTFVIYIFIHIYINFRSWWHSFIHSFIHSYIYINTYIITYTYLRN